MAPTFKMVALKVIFRLWLSLLDIALKRYNFKIDCKSGIKLHLVT